jgi:hypothetical protein
VLLSHFLWYANYNRVALLYSDSTHTLLSYKDIRKNGFYVKTHKKNKEGYLLFTKDTGYGQTNC